MRAIPLMIAVPVVAAWGCSEDRPSITPVPSFAYQVIKKWSIPNGGFGRVVVVDPQFRNEESMRKLGERLRVDTSDERNAVVVIYDDARAAGLRDAALADRLSTEDLAFHDHHNIGIYMRNANTGFNTLQIALNGIQEPSIEVKY